MDDFLAAVGTCLQTKYFDFKGRAARPEFWWFFLFQVIVLGVAAAISDILYVLAALALLLPGLGVAVRRLHDIGKSGWFVLIGLIPFVGFLVMIYFWVQPTKAETNEWGEPPAPAPKEALPPGAA